MKEICSEELLHSLNMIVHKFQLTKKDKFTLHLSYKVIKTERTSCGNDAIIESYIVPDIKFKMGE